MKFFPDLGRKINFSATLDDKIVNSITKSSDGFGKLQVKLWNERELGLKIKISVYHVSVIP